MRPKLYWPNSSSKFPNVFFSKQEEWTLDCNNIVLIYENSKWYSWECCSSYSEILFYFNLFQKNVFFKAYNIWNTTKLNFIWKQSILQKYICNASSWKYETISLYLIPISIAPWLLQFIQNIYINGQLLFYFTDPPPFFFSK